MASTSGEYVLFRWNSGGDTVFLCGSFNGWKRISMNKSVTGVFEVAVPLSAGTHEYKYVVDEQWRHDQDQLSTSDNCGGFNNVISVSGGEPSELPLQDTYQESDEDSDDDSDAESVCSSTPSVASSTGGSPSGGGPYVKLNIKHPPFVKKEQLKEHFIKNGFGDNITRLQTLYNKKTHKPKGQSRARLTPASLADEALLKLNGSLLFGKHKLTVRHKEKRQRRSRNKSNRKSTPVSNPQGNQESVKLYVGRIPPQVSDDQLRNHFKDFDPHVMETFIVKDKQTKKSKGCGFVKFSSRAAAERAVQKLNGSLIHGKQKILVEFAREPPANKGGSGVGPSIQGQAISTGLQEVATSSSPQIFPPPQSQTGFVMPQSGLQPEPTCVTIGNINPNIIEEAEVGALIDVPIVSFKPNKAAQMILIQLSSPSDAAKAAEALNGKTILGSTIYASVCQGENVHTAPTNGRGLVGSVPYSRSPSYPPPHPATSGGPHPALHPIHPHPMLPPGPPQQVHRPSPPYQMGPPGQTPPMMSQAPQRQPPNLAFAPNINPGLQSPLGPPPPYTAEPPSPSQTFTKETFGVKVTHLSPSVTKEILAGHFSQAGELSGMPKIHESKNRYAHVNFKSSIDADNAVRMLHGTILNGWKINVSRKRGSIAISSPPAAKSPESDFACLPTVQSPMKGAVQEEKVLKLQPDQWNQIMSVGPHSGSKFNEITAPFESNPNVDIQLQVKDTSIVFRGVRDAVLSAYNHLSTHLNKELHISNKMKMETLVQLYPELPRFISQKYGVTVSGYNPESNTIRFEGAPSNFENARKEIETIVSQWLFKPTNSSITVTPDLLSSAKKRFESEGISAYLTLQPFTQQLVVCSFSEQEQDKAIAVVQKGLVTKFVNTPSVAIVEQLANDPNLNFKKLEDEYLVAITTDSEQRDKILIYGFVQKDANAVFKMLLSEVKKLTVEVVPISCTPGQAAYIKHILESKGQGKPLLFPPSAKVVSKDDQILVSGSPDAIQKTRETIESLFSEVHCQLFSYNCHSKFLTQIKSTVLFPLKAKNPDFYWHSTEETSRGKGSRRDRKESSSSGFSILVFSKDAAAFGKVQETLSTINPGSQKFALPRRDAVNILEKVKPELENRYHVRILEQGSSLLIHGLYPDEIQQCWEEIEEKVTSTLTIEKLIPLNPHHTKYLKRKREKEIEEVKKDCAKFDFQTKHGESGSSAIWVRGTIKQVEAVEEKILEMISSNLDVDVFNVTCEGRLIGMWIKWWKEYKKKQEAQCDLVIDFYKRKASSAGATDELAANVIVDFEVCGTDISEIQEVKEAICQMETTERVLTMPKESGRAILKGLSEKKLDFLQKLPVRVEVEKPSLSKVTVISPQDATEDLDSAVEGIESFIGANTNVSKEITSSDPVVGLILCSKSLSAAYLSTANTLAKPHHVFVHPLKKPRIGLRLTGNQTAIQAVEPLIRTSILLPIEQSIGQLPPVKVKHAYGAILSTREFSKFEAKLQDDLCISLSYPKLGKQSRVIRSALIQPTQTARCVSFEICSGNIVLEIVDAIVNAANEDLKHIGGLAKAISDVGGPSVQDESDDYLCTKKKKLKPSDVVCLGAGKLPCKKVIHAVGPRWKGGTASEEQTLYFTIFNCLQCAEREKLGSIAFPAISTGIFGVPEDICARASMKAVRDFCQANPETSVHTVRFVLFTQSAVNSFVSLFDTGFFIGHVTSKSPAKKPVSIIPPKHTLYTWSWADDRGSFTSYQDGVSRQLNIEYSKNPNGLVSLTINGQTYIINFSTMTQTNAVTRHQRRIQREQKQTGAASSVQWLWKDDKGGFTPYSQTDSQAIENMYQSKTPHHLIVQKKTYMFDFTSMCQINVTSGYKRKIVRSEASPSVMHVAPESPQASDEDLVVQEKKEEPPQKDLVLVLRGPQVNLAIAKTKLDEKLKNLFKMKDIALPSALKPAFKKKLVSIAKKYDINWKFNESKKEEKTLHIEGMASSVQQATSKIQEEIISYQLTLSDSADLESAPPAEWQPQTTTTEVFAIPQGSAEWNRVEQRFKLTMPSSTIAQISRIQNKWLWDKYVTQKKRLHLKNNGNINEKELFHGTRGNDPKLIYEGEDGFDMRYSNAGMWGQANYFAVNASYSNGYAYTAGGHREMFLVKVLTGDSYNCSSNSSLRKPPLKQTGGASGGKFQFSQMHYDTVTGQTGGSQVFMTYDNDKAYPAYLIKYN